MCAVDSRTIARRLGGGGGESAIAPLYGHCSTADFLLGLGDGAHEGGGGVIILVGFSIVIV